MKLSDCQKERQEYFAAIFVSVCLLAHARYGVKHGGVWRMIRQKAI